MDEKPKIVIQQRWPLVLFVAFGGLMVISQWRSLSHTLGPLGPVAVVLVGAVIAIGYKCGNSARWIAVAVLLTVTACAAFVFWLLINVHPQS